MCSALARRTHVVYHPLLLLVLLLADFASAAPPPAADWHLMADPQILLFAGDGGTRVHLSLNLKPVELATVSLTRVPDRINPLDSKGTATIGKLSPTGDCVVSLSAPGVYQFRAKLERGADTTIRQAWVYVWDNVPALSPGKVGAYPDATPPRSVRRLAPDPGPYKHPRLLFTNAEWPEVNHRNRTGRVASYGLYILLQNLSQTLDDPTKPVGKLAQQLDAYAQSNYTGPAPDPKDIVDNQLYDPLYQACYVAWLMRDPKIPMEDQPPALIARGKQLARITAAAAHLHFAAQWDRATGKINVDGPLHIGNLEKLGWPDDFTSLQNLPYCYDFIYDWMDRSQRQEVRDFLYAVSFARHYSYAFDHGKPNDGLNQNGDFGNQGDNGIPPQLAIEGEEESVSPEVVKAFGIPDPNSEAAMWMKPSTYTDVCAWPHSTVATVDNLNRQFRMLNEWFLDPWGFNVTHVAYLGLSTTWYLKASIAFAHRGESIFVTSNYYNAVMSDFYTLEPGEKECITQSPQDPKFQAPNFRTWLVNCDHHDGGRGRPLMYFVWKYMYPDDPLVDYDYRAFLPCQWNWGWRLNDPELASMFGIDPGINGEEMPLEAVASIKKLPLLKFEPLHSIAISRNSWNVNDLNIWFDCDWAPSAGHQHAEKNSFSMYALGRMWCVPPGYHCTISDLQNQVLIQDPRYESDPASNGYIGESPSSATQVPPHEGNFPTPPGKLLEVSESPDHLYTTFAGDATDSYRCGFHGPRPLNTGKKCADYMYPGLIGYLGTFGDYMTKPFDQLVAVSQTDYNPVQYAIRTVLLVRGKRPYVLSVDDIRKDDAPHNYRWNMNDAEGFAAGQDNKFLGPDGKTVYSSLVIEPGATATQAIFRHSPIDDDAPNQPGREGLPRLLVRELSLPEGQKQPPIALQSRPLSDDLGDAQHPAFAIGVDNNSHKFTYEPSNCVQIDRNSVVEPHYIVLLFPFRTGEPMPLTRWDAKHTKLIIDLRNGLIDTITVDTTHPDHRTRLSLHRTR